jgi:hypothetical protein
MRRQIRIVAGKFLLFPLLVSLECSWAAGQSKDEVTAGQQKGSPDRPALAEARFGQHDQYLAALFCCWHVRVYERRGSREEIIWDWDKFGGGEGFKDDFLVRDVDEDGNKEVAFRISKANFCRLESAAVAYSPEKRTAFLLRHDGEIGLHLSPNLKDNHKTRDWLIKYWQDWYKGDLSKITVAYDAEP